MRCWYERAAAHSSPHRVLLRAPQPSLVCLTLLNLIATLKDSKSACACRLAAWMGGSARSAARLGHPAFWRAQIATPGAIRTGPLFRNAISAVEIEPLFRQDRGCRNKLAGKRTTLVLANSREMADLATFENNKLKLVLANSSLRPTINMLTRYSEMSAQRNVPPSRTVS